MVLQRIRFRLVTTLNVGAFCLAALWLAMLLPGQHGLLFMFFLFGVAAAWLVIPVAVTAHVILGRFLKPADRRDKRRYFILSYVVLVLGWGAILTPILVFPGLMILNSLNFWPLSLRDGPDTDYARSGFARVFEFDAPASATSVYFRGVYSVGDGTEWLRFDYQPGYPRWIELRAAIWP